MKITGSLIQSYLICPRQTWLMSRQITGDQYNEFLAIGRILSEETYKRDKKEIRVGSNVIDVVKAKDGVVTLIETKKSSRGLDASKFQILHYMYELRNKVKALKGEIRIPKEKKIITVELDKKSTTDLKKLYVDIEKNIQEKYPEDVQKNKYCSKCSYAEFCWS
jgi:CRISPR-associated exonuclease Cas4